MSLVLNKLLEDPQGAFLILIGIAACIWALSKLAPYPLHFIRDLIGIFTKEFMLHDGRLTIENINVLIIIIFLMLSIFSMIFEFPTILNQIGMDNTQGSKTVTITSIIILVIACFLSPCWILLLKKDINTAETYKQLLELLNDIK
ncbi:MAG: hypothetical protein C4541_13045 [Candidatus Auribacter fodinae]|jgi:ABC-type multidrug transport system permease subunit|uniref:Uncharacterized protein n=1 Tax=Candidatus Auribacter fodinae TaxID=2093366 RepID=A0A3A4QPW8_9BACT|nr:MAG: hypothetical protein C4541_13045 [Candidatus Auribacter fodinae]